MPSWGVEHGDRVHRADAQPLEQRVGVPGGERVQHQRREGEVVHPVDAAGDLDLVPVVGVHLDQHLEPALAAPRGDLVDEGVGVRRHERRGPGCLDRVADGVQPHARHAGRGQGVEHPQEVGAGGRVRDVHVDLPGGERRPDQPPGAVGVPVRGERQARPRAVEAQQVVLAGAVREDTAEGEEHAVELGGPPAGQPVEELRALAGHVVDDHVDHEVTVGREPGDVVPRAEPGVDAGVVDRVEAGVRAVVGFEERQHVDAAEQARQRAGQHLLQPGERPAEPVGVRDQLDLVAHAATVPRPGRTPSPGRACPDSLRRASPSRAPGFLDHRGGGVRGRRTGGVASGPRGCSGGSAAATRPGAGRPRGTPRCGSTGTVAS